MICDLSQKDGVHYGDGIPIENGTLTGVVLTRLTLLDAGEAIGPTKLPSKYPNFCD